MEEYPKPTESELQILQYLWKNGPSSVRSVNDSINEVKPTGYTTTLKLMQIMLEKGLVSRKSKGRIHLYSAKEKEEVTTSRLLGKFMDNVFGGSAFKLVMHALGQKNTDEEELQKIRSLIDEIEQRQQPEDGTNK